MSFRVSKYMIAVGILLPVYAVGFFGLIDTSAEVHTLFLALTPWNLILTTMLLLWFHQDWRPKFIFSGITIVLAGYFVEVAGVHTGIIFGPYHYGNTLGWQIGEVPWIIGLNWFLLIYTVSAVLKYVQNKLAFAGLGALILTGLDGLIEPVAIRLDFWQWETSGIPLQNYIAWFLVSFLFLLFFKKYNGRVNNKLASLVLAVQFTFFAALYAVFK
jgi:uncharacterized membrane protein